MSHTLALPITGISFSERLKITAGQIASLVPGEHHGLLGRLQGKAKAFKAASGADHEALRDHYTRFWEDQTGESYYGQFTSRFEDWFLRGHYEGFLQLRHFLFNAGDQFERLVEIGCGDGQVLNHSAGNLPTISRFTGIDMNAEQMEKNRTTYSSTGINFESGDAMRWLDDHSQPKTVYMTYGGVLEYFTQQELEKLFADMKKQGSAFCLTEPIAEDYDLANSVDSTPHGVEMSLSHNYEQLLRKAGFKILFSRETEIEARWVQIVAVAE